MTKTKCKTFRRHLKEKKAKSNGRKDPKNHHIAHHLHRKKNYSQNLKSKQIAIKKSTKILNQLI